MRSRDQVLGRMSEKSGRGVSFGIVRITDLDFAVGAVIFAGTTDVLAGVHYSRSEETEPHGLRLFLPFCRRRLPNILGESVHKLSRLPQYSIVMFGLISP